MRVFLGVVVAFTAATLCGAVRLSAQAPAAPAAPPKAVHGLGTAKDWRLEIWAADGLGGRIELTDGKLKLTHVFDARKGRSYEHRLPENVVTLEKRNAAEIREIFRSFTADGARAELIEALGAQRGKVREIEVVAQGRRLKKVFAPGTPVKTALYLDPASGTLAILDNEEDGRLRRLFFDYPASLDAALFEFTVPAGARVEDETRQQKR